ncbi:hypothetical protein AX16_002802 [Volvariella volvacea WC 439]|nr:hypothetical protein AX16_002802 [Volvariella volvacea WC 439]
MAPSSSSATSTSASASTTSDSASSSSQERPPPNITTQAPTEIGHGAIQEWSEQVNFNDPFQTPTSSRPSSVFRGHHTGHTSSFSSIADPRQSNDTSSTPTNTSGVYIVPRHPQQPGRYPAGPSSGPQGPQASSTSFSLHPPSGLGLHQTPSSRRVQPRMKSTMLPEGERMPKPWLEKKQPRALFAYWIVYVMVFIGIAVGVIQCYFTYTNVRMDREPLCLVLEENFDSEEAALGPGGTFWREVNMDGFGNGHFEMTTASQNNSYVQDGKLYIVPTLTSDSLGMDGVFDGVVYNITGCTFNETRPDSGFITDPSTGDRVFDTAGYTRACSAVSNRTAGTVVNPVQSARLSTKGRYSIKYGRVEIRAKMPTGDWMWPALWMLPVDDVYGPWPLSGEIDIVESRGNGIRYTARGSNYVQGTLNWGPSPQFNGASKSYSWWTDKRKSFSSDFHTYALEWTPNFIRIYVDTRLHTLLDIKFDRPFFERGEFPEIVYNGTTLGPLPNPWANGTNATPFDQEFYLILNVAVGGTNGWFPESQGNKPWLDNSAHPMRDFAASLAQWYPTWPTRAEDRAMVVDYVKMWKHCNQS